MKRFWTIFLRAILLIILTILTQIGGLIYLLSLFLSWKFSWSSRWQRGLVFISLYLLATHLVVPLISQRKALPSSQMNGVQPVTIITCLLNRHYVTEEMYEVLTTAATETGYTIQYMDACFPFFDGFPLVPHLSHDDGEKVDVAFQYRQSDTNEVTDELPTLIGYGSIEWPRTGEVSTAQRCASAGNPIYSMTDIIPVTNDEVTFDEERTRILIDALTSQSSLSKLFIEPHLKSRLGLTNNKIRFQGCHAVRHDDHIHLQQ